jgi:hypothetical protein
MGRRGNGEGSITRRKDGLYMARCTVETAMGAKRKALYAIRPARRSERSLRKPWRAHRMESPPTLALRP